MSIILGDTRREIPGVPTVCPLDDPRLPWATDTDPRTVPPLAIVAHATKGRMGPLLAEPHPPTNDVEKYMRYQARTKRKVSWDFTVSRCARVGQSVNPTTRYSWATGHANPWTLSIEQAQGADKALHVPQIEAAVALIEVLCAEYRITRRVLVGPDGEPWLKPVVALLSPKATDRDGKPLGGRGERWSGVLGHCNLVPSHKRGAGDPGPHLMRALLAAGFERFDVTDLARPT